MTTPIVQDQIANGTFTLQNDSGFHLTFKISTGRKGTWKGRRILSIMTGPDNEESFTGFGELCEDGTIKMWQRLIWKKNPATGDFLTRDQVRACMNLVLDHGNIGAENGAEVSKKFTARNGRSYELLVSTRCIVCNRKLTNPESVKAGIGPECYKREG